jgi:Sulfotransferase family
VSDAATRESGPAPARVLFIGGCGRSGSTLLDRMLGELPGFVSTGEVRFIWQRGLVENRLCGCGEPFRECPFWRSVGEEAFGGWDALDAEEVVALDRAANRHRYIPLLLAPRLSRSFEARLQRYVDILGPLYAAIDRVSGGACIVDSTKDPPFAFLLKRVPTIDLRIVHLVRDSRGVAFSWTKQVRRPEKDEVVRFMDTYHPVEMGVRWVVYNACFHLFGRLGVPRLMTRYEEVVASPRREIERMVALVGADVDPEAFDFLNGRRVELGVHHTISGNPMRFQRGAVELAVDEEWRSRLSPVHRRMVSLFTFPLLVRYGYLGPARPRQ